MKLESGKAEDHGLHDPISACPDQLVTALQQEPLNNAIFQTDKLLVFGCLRVQ
jgi:hypothetical protein